ncbi:MAG: hypothetical protein K2P57_09050 [Burkholderiales bacterium]|nr:hypothetical protein [Burkholderiales bacterium]MBY0579182.1 hypothetical protein [Burkholderiales bacterium]
MLQTVEAIVDAHGVVRLLEEVHVSVPTRAILTLLESPVEPLASPEHGSAAALLKFLEENPLPEAIRRTPEAIDAGIEEERNAWD